MGCSLFVVVWSGLQQAVALLLRFVAPDLIRGWAWPGRADPLPPIRKAAALSRRKRQRRKEWEQQQSGQNSYRAAIDLDIAREALDQAQTEEDRADARGALAEAEQALARQRAEEAEAEADYTHWFQSDPRAKVWLGIDVMFGKTVEG